MKSEECRAGGGHPPAVRPRLGVGAAFSVWDILRDASSMLGRGHCVGSPLKARFLL